MPILKARIDRWVIPIDLTPDGGNLILKFPYNKYLVEEVKNMEKTPPGWEAANKQWIVKNTKRNLFTLDTLCCGPRSDVYYSQIPHIDEPDLWVHQQDILDHEMARKRAIVAAEMRVGKTRPTLRAIELSKYDEAWWVAPKSALRGLEFELKKWNFQKVVHLLTYDKFTNMDSLDLPGFIVFDEAQKLKTPDSLRGKKAREISEALIDLYDGEEYVILLSGTPSPKDPSDWWNLTEVARPGWLRESSKMALQRRLANMTEKEGSVGQKYWHLESWKEEEVSYLHKRLAKLTIVKLKKDCLDLPQKIYEERVLPLSNQIKLIAKTIVANELSTLTALNKLRQLADGFQYEKGYDEDKSAYVRTGTNYVGSPKWEAFENDLDENEDLGRLVVYSGFEGSLVQLTQLATSKGWVVLQISGKGYHVKFPPDWEGPEHTVDDCLKAMDRSLDDKTIEKLVVNAQADAASTGLEFSATATVVYFSNSNNGDARMQSEDRPYSNNMDKCRGLRIVDYIYLPTDRKCLEKLKLKKDLQSLSMGDLKNAFQS